MSEPRDYWIARVHGVPIAVASSLDGLSYLPGDCPIEIVHVVTAAPMLGRIQALEAQLERADRLLMEANLELGRVQQLRDRT